MTCKGVLVLNYRDRGIGMGTASRIKMRISPLLKSAHCLFALILIAPLLLTACAASSQYMGIGFAPGAASTELQALAMRAQAGDKQAQLDLGIAYEEGRGVGVDLRKARKLYTLASADSGGTTWVYVPPVRNGEAGRVTPVDKGVRQSGLLEAKVRLERIEKVR